MKNLQHYSVILLSLCFLTPSVIANEGITAKEATTTKEGISAKEAIIAKEATDKKTSAGKAYDWSGYIDMAVGEDNYYLYPQAIQMSSFDNNKTRRAIDLGAGAGNTVVDMLSRGWDVTGVDKGERSKAIILERVKGNKGAFTFQEADITDATLTDNYDLVTSFYTIPFNKKEKLAPLLKNISEHMKNGGVLAFNLFGNEHTFVKSGFAFGMTNDEIKKLLADNHFEIVYFLNRVYDKPNNDNKLIHSDIIDVIAVKKE